MDTNVPFCEVDVRLGINALLCSPASSYRNAGVSRYIRNLVSSIGKSEEPPEAHLFLSGANNDKFPSCYTSHHTRFTSENPILRIAWEQTILPALVRRLKLDVLHSPVHILPMVCPCRSVVSIHDLTVMRFPQTFPSSQRRYLQYFTARAARKADAIITMSESTKKDIVQLLDVPERKIVVTPLGVDPRYRPATPEEKDEAARRYGVNQRTVLYLGTLEPRKNVAALLRAFDIVRKKLGKDYRLVLAGGKGWFYGETFRLVEELGVQDQVSFAGYVPDEDLPALYSASGVFAYPSLYEGFGLPPLEAMACGAPVVTSNTSSLPEVVGDAGITIDPHNVGQIADVLANVLADAKLRSRLSAMSLARSEKFSWDVTAHLTIGVYRDVSIV